MKVKDLVPYLALAAFMVATVLMVYVPTVVSALVAIAALMWSVFCIDNLYKPPRRHVERTGYPQIDAWLNARFPANPGEIADAKTFVDRRYPWISEEFPTSRNGAITGYFNERHDSDRMEELLDERLGLGKFAGSKPRLVCEPVVRDLEPTIYQERHGQYHIATWNAHLIGLPPDGTRQHFDTAVDHSGRNWQLLGATWVSGDDHRRRADRPFLPNGTIRRGRP